MKNTRPEEVQEKGFSLTLKQHEITRLLIGFFAVVFFTFVVGYYLGKKSATDQFLSQVDQEAFADKVYSSLCTLYEGDQEQREG